MFRFANPEFLALFAIIPVLIFWYIKRNKQASATLRYSNLGIIKTVKKSPVKRYRHLLFVLRLLVISLIIVGFARPQDRKSVV